jgi:putative FmdB family regulatory protein
MPTYDYRCKACDHEFELFQSMTASVKKKCPECNKLSLERLIGTGAAVIFKGSGFYETDYRSKSYKDAAKKDKEAAKPPAASTDTKTSSKSDGSGKSVFKDTSSKPAGGSKKSSE